MAMDRDGRCAGDIEGGPLAVHPFLPTRSNATFIGFRCSR
jgi:hypothetical protein